MKHIKIIGIASLSIVISIAIINQIFSFKFKKIERIVDKQGVTIVSQKYALKSTSNSLYRLDTAFQAYTQKVIDLNLETASIRKRQSIRSAKHQADLEYLRTQIARENNKIINLQNTLKNEGF